MSDWSSLADRVAALVDAPFARVNEPFTPEARAGLDLLRAALIADQVPVKVANHAVDRWMIELKADGTRKALEDLVAEEMGEAGNDPVD